MAEIGFALTVAGMAYILSNQKEDPDEKNSHKTIENFTNYPSDKNELVTQNEKKLVDIQQQNDKYFSNNNNASFDDKVFSSLTGENVPTNYFKNHNNNVPFFGAKIKGSTNEHNSAETRLDYLQGNGSNSIQKEERAPLFKPENNLHHTHGTHNVNDFLQSRVNPSMKISNIKPWEEDQIAPGLNKGFNSDAGAGFNSGLEARHTWMPKDVNELRVETNPKVSYELTGHEGPVNNRIKEMSTLQMQGKIEKNRPDTDYELGKDRWFTTTGAQIAQTTKSEHIMQNVNREETSCSYYGASNDPNASYVTSTFEESKCKKLDMKPVINIKSEGQFHGTNTDFGTNSYQPLQNNRTTTQHELNPGPLQSLINAVISPVIDVLRPTRKENVIGNLHPNGFVATTTEKRRVEDQDQELRVTNREMIGESTYVNMGNQNADGYLTNDHQPTFGQRDSTSVSYIGSGAPNGAPATKLYDHAYKQRNNVNKTYENRPNQGGTQIFNHSTNISIHKQDCDRMNQCQMMRTNGPSVIPTNHFNGKMNLSSYEYRDMENNDRIDSDLLTAFKNNPYTHSLTSHS